MILFLLLLIAAYVLVGAYAYQNPWTHDVTLFSWHWTGVVAWWPVVLASVAIGALFLLYMVYAGVVHGVRYGSVRRRVTTHESAIADLRTENTRLREENARLRGQLRGVTTAPGGTAPASTSTAAAEGAPRPVRQGTDPYPPQPTLGERMRSFFSGREPSNS